MYSPSFIIILCTPTVILPQAANLIMPSDTDPINGTPSIVSMICGISEPDVAEHNFTWYTPSGEKLETMDGENIHQEGRFEVRIVGTSINSLHNLTNFIINELSYLDEGEYICSASYLTRSATEIMTSNATVNLQLKGTYE